jgi:hypothetical protein
MFDKEQSNLDQNSSLKKSDGTVVKWFGVEKFILCTKILKIRLQRAKGRCLPYKLN